MQNKEKEKITHFLTGNGKYVKRIPITVKSLFNLGHSFWCKEIMFHMPLHYTGHHLYYHYSNHPHHHRY